MKGTLTIIPNRAFINDYSDEQLIILVLYEV